MCLRDETGHETSSQSEKGFGVDNIYYFAAWTDSGCLLGCDHEHRTVVSAVACISTAGGYVIAVQNRTLRALNDAEEAEFQAAMYGNKSVEPQEVPAYAVTVRIKLVPET